MLKVSCYALLAAGLMIGGTAQGAIVYVDATIGGSGNTAASSGATDAATFDTTSNDSVLSTLWKKRTLGTNTDLWQGMGSSLPELQTSVTGLSDNLYNVWVFFYDSSNGTDKWRISAGLNTGALTNYSVDTGTGATTTGVVLASTLDYVGGDPLFKINTPISLYAVNIGQVTVSDGSPDINVFIDNNNSPNATERRAFYDGVGYEVVPEPSSLALLGLGGLCMMRRRR